MSIIPATAKAVFDAYSNLSRAEQDFFKKKLDRESEREASRLRKQLRDTGLELEAVVAEFNEFEQEHKATKAKCKALGEEARDLRAANANLQQRLSDGILGRRGHYKPTQIAEIQRLRNQEKLSFPEIGERLSMNGDAVKKAYYRDKLRPRAR